MTADRREKVAAGLLLVFTVIAIGWANSPWGESYSAFWDTEVGLSLGGADATLTLAHLVNDALMSVFFFVVGLEVKSQFVVGELTDRARAAVPVVAAFAGLVVPAAIFLLINAGGEYAVAWGVVISTDTAFLVGALAVIGPKFPARLRLFLLTLAIVDDVGALLAIALFYSDELKVVPIVVSAMLLVALGAARRLPAPLHGPAYTALGVVLWLATYNAGVHPTLAGVAVALLIPVFSPQRERVEEAAELIRAFRQSPNSEYARAAARGLRESISVNERLQTAFGGYVAYLVLPLFALANAGVRVDGDIVAEALRSPLCWGIVAGLVVGKFLGITTATAMVQATRWGQLAPGLTMRRVAGGAALSGIGFTISLFIVDIAIDDERTADLARVAVLAASVIAFGFGALVFFLADRLSPPKPIGAVLVRPVDVDRDHHLGRVDAPLVLVEYGDFECSFCSRVTGSIDEVRDHFGDDLLYVWRHFPLERMHPRAHDAALASEAAAAQGRFFEMGRQLFAFQDYLDWPSIYRYAHGLGLDVERFDTDLRSPTVAHRVADDTQDAEVMDLSGTPTFFVGGRRHDGPFDAASLIRALEACRSSKEQI